MKLLRVICGIALLAATVGCTAYRNYSQSKDEEALQHWDLALQKLEKAIQIDPQNPQYKIALVQLKLKASQYHFEKGKLYRASGNPELAVVELEQAVLLDPTNKYAETELRKAQRGRGQGRGRAQLRARSCEAAQAARRAGARARAPLLEPASDKPISLNFPQPKPIKQIYQSLAAAAGINVIFDPQLKDDNVSIVLHQHRRSRRRSRPCCGRRTTSTR